MLISISFEGTETILSLIFIASRKYPNICLYSLTTLKSLSNKQIIPQLSEHGSGVSLLHKNQ